MAKAFTTYKLLNGKEPLLRRLACEVRYQDGQRYLDQTGRLLKKLMQIAPEWVVTPDPTVQGTVVHHLVEGYSLNFSMNAAILDLNQSGGGEVITPEEAEEFINQAEAVLGLVVDELEATQFTRVGYREWYHFSCETKEENEQWLRDLGFWSINPTVFSSFQGNLDAHSITLVMQGQDCNYRIALNGIERSAQVPVGDKNVSIRSSTASKRQKQVLVEALKKKRQRQVDAAFAAVLDIDSYQLEPPELDLAGFIRECHSKNLDRFRDAVSKDKHKKGQ